MAAYLGHALSSLRREQTGAMALTIGLMVTALAGVVGMSLDLADWYSARRVMQSAADAAALGGALELYEGGSSSQATTAATTDGNLNKTGFAGSATLSISVNTSANTVTATMTKKADLLLSGLLLGSAPTISVTATAGVVNGGSPACLLVTSPSASGALTLSGNGTVQASGCGIVVDSSSTSAMTTSGNATADGKSICGPGSYSTSGNSGFSPTPTRCIAMADTLGGLAPPSDPSTCTSYSTLNINSTVTLQPGLYCGGISFSGNANVTLSPGVYVMAGGDFNASGNSVINGTGVTLYLTGGGSTQLSEYDTSISGNVVLNITAPTSGTFAGFAIYQDGSDSTGTLTSQLSGNGNINFTGVLYFGNQNVTISGNAVQNGTAAFTAVVANEVTYSGNGTLDLNANYSSTNVPLPSGLHLPVVGLIQ